jgi:hypothetical protein
MTQLYFAGNFNRDDKWSRRGVNQSVLERLKSSLLTLLRPDHDSPARNVNLSHNLARILNKSSPDSELSTSGLLPEDVIGLAAFSAMISISTPAIVGGIGVA